MVEELRKNKSVHCNINGNLFKFSKTLGAQYSEGFPLTVTLLNDERSYVLCMELMEDLDFILDFVKGEFLTRSV